MKHIIQFLFACVLSTLVSCSSKQEKSVQSEVAPVVEECTTAVMVDTVSCIEEDTSADEPMAGDPVDWANMKIKRQFKKLTSKQVQNLLRVWYNVSKQYAETQRDTECDSIFNLVFRYCERGRGNCKEYFVLPTSIPVHVHKKTVYKSVSFAEFVDKYKNNGKCFKYLPHLKTNRKVLYQFSAVNDLLHTYVQGNIEHRKTIRQYVNIRKNYYCWQAEDYPQITDIYLFSNGTAVYYFASVESHGLIFMPKDSDDVTIETWFEDEIEFDDEEYDDE